MIALAPDPIDPAALLAEFTRGATGVGAIVSFSGIVRPDGGVRELWLDHHEFLALAAFEAIESAARERFAVANVTIVHRIGSVGPGEPIVFVAAAATHRRDASPRRIAATHRRDASPRGVRRGRLCDGPAQDRRALVEARNAQRRLTLD